MSTTDGPQNAQQADASGTAVAPDGARRRAATQHVLDVVGTEHLTPNLVRIHLGGDGFDDFMTAADPERLAKTDKYVKILFAKPELGLEPPYDLEALRVALRPEDMPVRRTYTVRSVNAEARSLAIDFVVHGDEGIAGPWAATAVAGDRLCFSGPGGQYTPSADDVDHLFLGDDSAIPAIAAAVEALPSTARGLVLIEVQTTTDELSFPTPRGVELRWIHRRADGGAIADHGAALVEAVRRLAPPSRALDVFAHGEREAMKELRRILQTEWGLDRRSMSLSAYWANGRSEDRFQAEKREPVGQIFED